MFKKGDYIVYPVHGVGQIKKIEKKKIEDKTSTFYVIEFFTTNMRIMLPVEKAEEVGLRPVVNQKDIKKVFDILKGRARKMPNDWKVRYQINVAKMKTGSIFEIAEIVRDLRRRSKTKELSAMEKKMLEQALDHIILEISKSKGIEYSEAEELVKKHLK